MTRPTQKKTVLCIPGLGGHRSVFANYVDLLPEHNLHFIELVDRRTALAAARAFLERQEGQTTLFCHCYSAQMGIQLALEMPDKVKELIFLEPFFSEFQIWMRLLLPINVLFLAIVNFFDMLGLHRQRFTYQPDYVALAKYPIYLQPFFDMRWQGLDDYFDKCWDILTYRLPPRVDTPTLMLFSPGGFTRDARIKEKLLRVFPKASMVAMNNGTHNVITMGGSPVAAAVRKALNPTTYKP
jgi:pimeloyl-ACP methyl ester carboxylesterase